MSNNRFAVKFVHAALGALAATLLFSLPVRAAENTPAADKGYADPAGIPARAPVVDIEPVYRGPAIDTIATIRKRGVLRVGVAAAEPMVIHDAKGALTGYSIDIGNRLAEDLGVAVEFVETSWANIIPDLLNREFDLIASGLWMTPARALVVNFSNPTATEGVYLIAGTASASGMKSVADFNKPDVKLVAANGTIQERATTRLFPKATLVKVEGNADQFEPVLAGKAHAVLVPTFAPEVLVKSAPDKLFLVSTEPLLSTAAALAVRKGDADFVNYLNSWLTMRQHEGWLQERRQYWSTNTDWLK